MSSTLSSASTLDPLSVYYGNNIPAQMSAVRNGYLRDLHETVADLMNKINLQSPEGVQRLRDAEETIFQTSRTETGEYVCRYENCAHCTVMNENQFLYGYMYYKDNILWERRS